MSSQPLTILHRDAGLVAIDKPAGLLVHPSALDRHEEHNALELLQGQLGEVPADIRHQGFAPKRSMLMVLENGTPGLETRYASGELKPYPVDFG